MRRNISNVLCVIGAPPFGSTLAPRRSITVRNSAGTWSRAPGKQFGVLGRWRDRHTRPARWSDTLRIRPVRWRKWNRIQIDLARLADPIPTSRGLMQGINTEKSSQGCCKAIQIGFCDSYHNKIIDIQNRLPYSKVVYLAIIVIFTCLMEVNHGAGSRPNYPFR